MAFTVPPLTTTVRPLARSQACNSAIARTPIAVVAPDATAVKRGAVARVCTGRRCAAVPHGLLAVANGMYVEELAADTRQANKLGWTVSKQSL